MNKSILIASLVLVALIVGASYWSNQSPTLASQNGDNSVLKAQSLAKAETLDRVSTQSEAVNVPTSKLTDPSEAKRRLEEKELAALLDKRLTPTMKREINAMLNPDQQGYPEQQGESGAYVDLSRRAFSVPVAVIDDNGNTIVTDVTQPLPVNEQ